MPVLLSILLILLAAAPAFGFTKTAVVERFTNTSCGPCASVNTAWYTATVEDLESQGLLHHVVYNVNWPGDNDPMYLLNADDNMTRRNFYAVSGVPWIVIDGTKFERTGNTGEDQANFTDIVTAASGAYSPFRIDLEAEAYGAGVIDVRVKVLRDPGDSTTLPPSLTLQVGLVEDMVSFDSPPGSNGERDFPDVCRKMMEDAFGTGFAVPAPGDSISFTFVYLADAAAQAAIDFENVSVIAFVQQSIINEIFQSSKVPAVYSTQVHAAFRAEQRIGAAGLIVDFEDHSTPTDGFTISSWEWDLDGDGSPDSTDPEPSWTYTLPGTYSVSLTVDDGSGTNTMLREGYVQVIENQSEILLVNGIEYMSYGEEMENFYASSAVFGNHQVDVWDLFGAQGFDYSANLGIAQILEHRNRVPDSVFDLYQTVIWVGNHYHGDLNHFDSAQVLDYLADGGNFVLATRLGSYYLDSALMSYCGIQSVSGDQTATELLALEPELVDVPALAGHTYTHFVELSGSSEAVPLFRDAAQPSLLAGFMLRKEGEGSFVFVAGRPYRYAAAPSFVNYNYMLGAWLSHPTGAEDLPTTPTSYTTLDQNHPNPFNPVTTIRFQLAQEGRAHLSIYDLQGRLVRRLAEGFLPAGPQELRWDGRDDQGHQVTSGMYLYRLDTADGIQTKRMLLVK